MNFMTRNFFFLLAFTALTAHLGWAQTPLAQAEAALTQRIATSGAETVSVALYDFAQQQSLYINEHASFHAASTMKLPVMMEIFRRVSARQSRLNERLPVKNSFASIVDGSAYTLNQADDSDAEIYRRLGQTMTVLELTDRMITWSSNLATNLLIEKFDARQVTALAQSLGAHDTHVLRGVEDTKAFNAGLNNVTTAYDLMLMLKAIQERKVANGKACDQMINILASQHYNAAIPAGLPPGTKVAHKTGSITKHNHDAAIVFPPGRKPFILVVLTRGLADENASHQLIADIARIVYGTLVR